MSAHLAMPTYLPYPGSVVYGDYYWLSPGSMDNVPVEEAPPADTPPFPAAVKTPSHPGKGGPAPGDPSGCPGLGGKGGVVGGGGGGVPRVPPAPGWGAMPVLPPQRGCDGRCSAACPAAKGGGRLPGVSGTRWDGAEVGAEKGGGGGMSRLCCPQGARGTRRFSALPAAAESLRVPGAAAVLNSPQKPDLEGFDSSPPGPAQPGSLSFFLLRCLSGFLQLWDAHPVHPRLRH